MIVATIFSIAYSRLARAGLDYLGFGVPPNVPTWGNMLTAANEHLSGLSLLVIALGLALTLVIVSMHLVGEICSTRVVLSRIWRRHAWALHYSRPHDCSPYSAAACQMRLSIIFYAW